MNRSSRIRNIALLAALLVVGIALGFLSARRVPASLTTSPAATAAAAPQGESPVREPPLCRDLFAVACTRRGVTRDPSGSMLPSLKGEVEALRRYEEIIHQHPDWTSEQVDEELVRQIYTEKRRKSLTQAFDWIKVRLKRFIERQKSTTFTAATKEKLIERIDGTLLELPPPASVYASEPDLFTKNEIYYETLEDGRRVIRVGGAYLLTSKSWFNRVFTLAHELAHAIDPCELRSIQLEPPAYRALARCFARRRITGLKHDDLRCGQRNRLSEAFADWIASEITADAFKSYAAKLKTPNDRLDAAINAIRDLCNQEPWVIDADHEIYPDPSIRIGVLFAGHPRIQELLECRKPPEETEYCSFVSR